MTTDPNAERAMLVRLIGLGIGISISSWALWLVGVRYPIPPMGLVVRAMNMPFAAQASTWAVPRV